MKKTINADLIKKHTSQIILSAVCVTALGVAALSMDGQEKKTNTENVESIPSAGIAPLLTDNNNDEIEDNHSELVGGIATILNDYYNEQENYKSASVVALENAISMLPQNAENVEEVVQASDVAGGSETQNSEVNVQKQENEPEFLAQYNNLGVANVTNYLNVRETPDLGGKLLGKLPMNAGCEILETHEGWYKVKSGSVEGFVSAEYLLTGDEAKKRALEAVATMADVNADMLMVREEPNTDCTILTRVAEGESLEVVEELDGWVKININNRIGYVCADYVTVNQSLPKGVTMKELSYGSGVSQTAVDLIEYAKQFLGNPYVYGGTSLTNGTDCSGFTMRIYEHFGYSLSRTSRSQAYDGTRVSLSEIQPGDLLFYSYGSTIGHVAIYIGNGQIIHASTERTGIIIGNAYYSTPTCAVRILN